MINNERKLKCPRCKSTTIDGNERLEYTGGGYAMRWIDYRCLDCNYCWHTKPKIAYY